MRDDPLGRQPDLAHAQAPFFGEGDGAFYVFRLVFGTLFVLRGLQVKDGKRPFLT